MYIAFKWLVALSLLMWLMMCIKDSFLRGNRMFNTGIINKPFINYKNDSTRIQLMPIVHGVVHTKEALHPYYNETNRNTTSFHILMFIAGALVVTVFQRKRDIVTFAHQKIPTMKMVGLEPIYLSKIAAMKFRDAIVQHSIYFWEKLKIVLLKTSNSIFNMKKHPTVTVNDNRIHIILLKKLKDMAEERKSLGQLLISAIRENKNIRMRYELETMTKNRLMQHIEDTQKQVKENRSRYVSFQQLYLITHQENIYLKARLVKLKREKEETEKDLMGLVNEVYMSKNKDLKSYCTRFLVKTKDNLLNSDVESEIKQFLDNRKTGSGFRLTAKRKGQTLKIPSSSGIQITEIINEDDCLSLESDAPKLRGLPGEYVWTVKDKNGFIEKLYEYDFESDLDSGETIRRIRQYSVYFDKDCLLDYSRTENRATSCSIQTKDEIIYNSLSTQKLVTGSKAFQNFLKNSSSIVQIKPSAHRL